MSSRSLGRIDEFEGLRGVLSLIVLVGHLGAVQGRDWMPWFWGTMEVFFVLSGFLITRLLLGRSREIGVLRRYFLRRALRIWPVYYVVLFAVCALDFVLARSMEQPSLLGLGVLKSVFFLQNIEMYLGDRGEAMRTGYATYFGHSWSVALEEQFYVLLPLFLCAGVRLRWSGDRSAPGLLLAVGVGVLLFCTALRSSGWNVGILVARADGFVLGTLLAIHRHRGHGAAVGSDELRFFRVLMGIGVVTVISVVSVYELLNIPGFTNEPESRQVMSFGIPAFAILGLALVALCVDHSGAPLLRPLRIPLLQHLGRISYSTYLWHVPLLAVLVGIFSQKGPWPLPEILKFPLIVLTILVLSHFSYRMIEQPAMALKRRYEY